MRILQIIESAAAGSGHQVLMSSRAMARRGVHLAIVYSDARADKRFLTALADLTAEFPETQVKMIRMRRPPHPSDLFALLALRQFAHQAGPFDVIHSHCTKAGFLARIAFPLSRRLHAYSPHAFLSMSPLNWRLGRALISSYERLMAGLTTTVIAVSSEEYDHALKIGIPPRKVEIVANGVDLEELNRHDWATERAKHRAALGLEHHQVCVGFLGRLAPQKDLPTLLRAFATVLKTARREALLILVGSGPNEPTLRRLATDLQIDKSVRWVRAVETPAIAAAFDIFALSSLYEGLPNSLLEAMALRLPCVVTKTGGAADLVRSGVNGFVVPVSDPGSLSIALSTLVDDAALRDEFGGASAALVEPFDIVHTTGVMLQTLAVRHRASAPPPMNPSADAETIPTGHLRILQFVESAATGVGRHVADLTQQLLDRGHEVHLIHSSTNMDSRFGAALGRLKPKCKTTAMAMHHNVHPGDAALILRLRKYLHDEGPFDVIHCHSSKAGVVGRLAAVGTGTAAIYTPHALYTMNPSISALRRKIAKGVEVILARSSARVIAVSEEEYRHARQIGIPENRLARVPNGVPVPRRNLDKARKALATGRREVRIGFVGRLVPQKAVDHLLKAFALMRANLPATAPTLLLIAGDGPLADPLRALSHSLGIEDSVKWLGDVNADHILSHLDVFAIPSDYEGFPYVILEAMLEGLPIVSTNVGGTAELVRTGVNGLVVPRRDVPAFANALAALAADADLRRRMGKASHGVVKEFSTERMATEIIGLYHAARQEPIEARVAQPPSRGGDAAECRTMTSNPGTRVV
jgi:glycosyltransferase involved in cell wall biosynthesis